MPHYTTPASEGITVSNLTELRKQTGLTQDDMSAHMGVNRSTIITWEKNPEKMRVRDYNRYISILNNNQPAPVGAKMNFPGFTHDMVEQIEAMGIVFPDEFYPYAFVPREPVTFKAFTLWQDTGREPYVGFGAEFDQWDVIASDIRRQVREKKNGVPIPTHTVMEEDKPALDVLPDGSPVAYDEPTVVLNDDGSISIDNVE